jgi:O-antigen/teichoic acid export membrane protein
MSSIKKLAIRGAIWTIASYGTSQILRFGSNLILTRLLFPKLFGLMALVYVFITGLHLFSDIGIATSVVQNKRGDEPAFLNTAWTLQVIRGLGLWCCCLLLAWPVSKFYEEPQLLWLLPVVGLNTFISGFNSTALFTLNRHMAVRQLAFYELGGQVVSLTVMIVWAYLNRTVWAIVAGGFVSALFQLVWSHRLNTTSPNRFAWEPEATKEIISFGKWIFVSTAMTFLAWQTDRLILGKLLSIEMLGIYGIALTLSDIPRQVVLAVSSKVIFPAFSKLVDLPRETFRAKIQKNRQPILIAMALVLALSVSFGDLLVSVLYDQRYANAAWMMPIISLGIWPTILTQTIDPSLFAIGKPRYVAYGCFFSFLFLAIGIPLGFSMMSTVGAIIAVPLSNLPFYGVIAYGLWRERLACIGQDIKATVLFLLLLSVAIGCRYAAGFGIPINGLF